MKLNKYIAFCLLAFIGFTAMIGCRKKQDTIAKIVVRDASNQAVVGARVVLYGQSTTSTPASVTSYDTTSTNSSGEAVFNFNEKYQLGQAGVAVLNIDVDKGALTGQGIIKVEQEVTTTETVFVQ
ncbi:MAG: hypothetical protein MK066_01420 [Crocinitomicaceae bacterium]|nr:hypothetical protein [Crocinitomicaceae bacterium]